MTGGRDGGGNGATPAVRAALVTGAGVRIGRAIALDLAAAGWSVAVHYNRSGDAAETVAASIRDVGGCAVAVRADLAIEDAAAGLIERAVDAVGSLDCLINNASLFENDTPATATKESWDAHMQINLRSPFVLIQHFLAQLPTAAAGNIINILDQRVWHLTPYFTSYTVSKVGLWTLTQTLAMSLAPRVRVNAVGPGPTLPSARQSEAQFARQWSSTPLARPVAPQEIAAAVRFLLGAPSVTGQMIATDAGQHLGWPRAAANAGPMD